MPAMRKITRTPTRKIRTTGGLTLTFAVLATAGACTGKIEQPGMPGPGASSGAAGTSPVPGPSPGTGTAGAPAPIGGGGNPGGPGMTAPPGPTAAASFIDPSSTALARLTNVEYSQTVTDVLGEPPNASTRYKFPDDPRQHGFDNNVTLLQISSAHGDRYATAAEGIAAATFADTTRRALVMKCDPATGAACLSTTIRGMGRRLYRRPLADAEVTSFAALAAAGANPADPYSGARTVLEAMLQSPNFLYRVQIGVKDAKRPTIVGLTGFELATRLSFLLLGTTPDDALLDQAQNGGLDTPVGVNQVVQTMLADPRARRGVKRFYEQWLPLTEISGPSAEAERIPHMGDTALAADLVEETRRLVDDVLWGATSAVPDLLTARYTFVNANLAKLYGLPAPAQGTAPAGTPVWARVDFPTGSTRAGILTQGSLLAAGSHNDTPSNTRRGQMVREQLLCQDIPAPPPGVANSAPPPMAGETAQQTFARHTTQASCAVCHTLMDPIGWGLSGFDAAGAVRTKDNNGQPLSVKGQINGFVPPDFDGPVDLAQKVASSPQFKACFARQLFRYVYGRVETTDDEPGITELQTSFTNASWKLGGGLAALASSDGLRYRTKGDAP
jgi:hypothetical protein